MEISDLATFAAVARCAGITKAARQLNTVQSNVTTRIKSLEDEVGVPLFERHSRGVVLTSAGHRLLPYAERAAALVREAAVVARDDGEPRGLLTIGAMETSVAVRLPPILANFHANHPDVQLAVRTGPTASLVDMVLNNEVDGAFIAAPIDHPAIVAEQAFEEELVLVSSHRWSSLQELRRDAGTLSALMFRTGCSYRQRLEQALVALGRPSFQRLEFGTLEGILGCVAADVGVTLLPRSVVESSGARAGLRIHDVEPALARAPTLFVRRKAAFDGTVMRCFLACIPGRKSAESSAPLPRVTLHRGAQIAVVLDDA